MHLLQIKSNLLVFTEDLERNLLPVVSNTKIKALSTLLLLGDNCIQNVHFGKYIVGFMVGNFVLRRRVNAKIRHLSATTS